MLSVFYIVSGVFIMNTSQDMRLHLLSKVLFRHKFDTFAPNTNLVLAKILTLRKSGQYYKITNLIGGGGGVSFIPFYNND